MQAPGFAGAVSPDFSGPGFPGGFVQVTKRTYRSDEQARVIYMIVLIVVPIVIGQTFWAYERGKPWWLIALMLLTFSTLGFRAARSRVEVEEQGIIVHNRSVRGA